MHSVVGLGVHSSSIRAARRSRLAVVGVEWLGLHRLRALMESDAVEVAALVGPVDPGRWLEGPSIAALPTLEDLQDEGLDGWILAGPIADQHPHLVTALESGTAVFGHRPLARSAADAEELVAAARRSDSLLAVDGLRHARAAQALHECTTSGELGRVHSVQLTFHNALGPDQTALYHPRTAGGGCLMDHGLQVLDLALWCLAEPAVARAAARLYRRGEVLGRPRSECEDHAVAHLETEGGAVVQLRCSWRLATGSEVIIEVMVHGTRGSACLRNVGGCRFELATELHLGAHTETLCGPPDAFGGRALADWVRALERGCGFDPRAESLIHTHRAIDAIYRASGE